MSNLSEEEIIKILTAPNVDFYYRFTDVKEAVQGLLNLYKKEKEKNNILELEIDKLNQEKEQYKIVGQTNFVNAFIERNYISKDKIREKIKELEQIKNTALTERTIDMKNDKIIVLEQLLEE